MVEVLWSSWSRMRLMAEKALGLKRIEMVCGEESLNCFRTPGRRQGQSGRRQGAPGTHV